MKPGNTLKKRVEKNSSSLLYISSSLKNASSLSFVLCSCETLYVPPYFFSIFVPRLFVFFVPLNFFGFNIKKIGRFSFFVFLFNSVSASSSLLLPLPVVLFGRSSNISAPSVLQLVQRRLIEFLRRGFVHRNWDCSGRMGKYQVYITQYLINFCFCYRRFSFWRKKRAFTTYLNIILRK